MNDAPSEGHREQEMADDLLRRLKMLGFETNQRDVFPDRPNVWGRLRGAGNGPTIMLAAHLDTVGVEGYDAPFAAELTDGCIRGRGSCDMKAAIACYLEVATLLQEQSIRLPGDLIIAGLADEEHLLTGSAEMGRNGPHADFGIIGEPTGLAICSSHKGQIGVNIRTFGVATHSSGPENGINAVEHMGAVIQHLSSLNSELQQSGPSHPLCGTGRFSMNVIRGGDIISAIPNSCEMDVDRRFVPGEKVENLISELRERIDLLSNQIDGFHAEVSGPTLLAHALDVPVTSPIIQALIQASREVSDREPEVTAFPGGTDAPNLGFPCVICGPGDLAQAHSIDEYVKLSEMKSATEIYLNTILSLNGVV